MKRQYIGGLILLLAVGIATAALLLMLESSGAEETVAQEEPTATNTATMPPTFTPTASPTAFLTPTWTPIPTADADYVETLAAQPLGSSVTDANAVSRVEDPFTINPEPFRSAVIQYIIQRGDNITAIAERFGITTETIVWSNRHFYMNALQPGRALNILPVDGALHYVQEPMTVRDLATLYQVEPYAIIDSDYNQLKEFSPQNMLPVGLAVVVPGGIGWREPSYWEPPNSVYIEPGGSFGETNTFNGQAVFGAGQPGSCGKINVYNGTVPSVRPASGYVLSNDYTTDHGGVDLAATIGTPIVSVGDGTVIFSGWSDWGYGYMVVVAHGSVMSVYAHMNGTVVYCGQQVEAGQYLGPMGSSGWSSGPHLHFEIRNAAGVRQNPHSYLGF